ncbi:hypothetical protein K402DRAFT_232840 [Aulographum hederae CBS 113979]|uniref:Copper transport protein n=1 Tax=Aulographum hederae CBS 113979 TaxID=1176131 RepID=A0A6G1GLJ3_9PEZI|nr:hypothetical protein K402DRAFT_232840 [Aulographum hederae CBS 113979]
MLWNWYTLDTCFLSSSWHITSKGMFAGSCIGVVCLVVALEFLRRLSKEYDRYLYRSWQRSAFASAASRSSQSSSEAEADANCDDGKNCAPGQAAALIAGKIESMRFRPNVLQQAIRALLHMLQFAVAYIVMLLAMYYNG